jgi:hypothetical protein
MSHAEIDLFASALQRSSVYLEYGAGGSTKLAASSSALKSITSVESDPVFLETHVRNDTDVQRAISSGRLRFLIADIGPTGDWGYPKDSAKMHLWPNYALCPYLHGYNPDLILIDGRFRVACGLAAALQAPEATVLIHDYTDRRNYHVLDRFFTINKRVDTLVECRKRQPFDDRFARSLLHSYLYAPADEYQTTWAKARRFLRKVRRTVTSR